MCVHGFVSGQVKNYTTKDKKQKSFVGEVRYKFREGENVDVFKLEHLTRCLRAQGEEIELNTDYDYTDDSGQTRKVERRAIRFYKFSDWYNLEVTRGEGKYTYQSVVNENSFDTWREMIRTQKEFNEVEFG
jgi:hypothetical protein